MATTKKSVQTILKEMFPDKDFISHYKPSYLKNKVLKPNKTTGDAVSTNRPLSISHYCAELKFGVCCTSVPLCTWHDVDEQEMLYHHAIDEFKVNECKKNGDFIIILPIVPENVEALVRTAYEQHISSQ